MDAALRNAVRHRARFRCEYSLLSEAHAPVTPVQVEHTAVSRRPTGVL